MDAKPTVVGTNYLTPDRVIDFSSELHRFRRMAEEYRTLADGAKSENARQSYVSIAADYDDLAKLAEETLASARIWRS